MAGSGNSGGTNTKAAGNYGGFGQGDGYTNDTYGGYATPQQQYEFMNGAGTYGGAGATGHTNDLYGGQLNASNPTANIQLDSGNGGSMTAAQIEAMRAMRDAEANGVQQPQPQNTTFTPTTLPTDFNVNTSAATGIYNAGNTMANEAGYQPSQIGAPTSAQLGQYTNPWESQVVDQSLADLERSRLTAQNIGGANAGAANAFGGSRQGVAEAETNRAYADQVARTTSGLRQTGYQNAQDMARQADINNQSAGLTGSQNRQGAATNLANVSNLGFNMGQTIQGNMDQQGAMQQQQQQQLINKAKEAMAGYTGSPADSLQYLLAALGQAPSSSTTTTEKNAGLLDYLSVGLGAL